jgi:flagellar assembly protein FliH
MVSPAASVLRNVVMQDPPHALARPRLTAVLSKESDGPAAASATVKDLPGPNAARGFEEGYAAGYREGMLAGRAAQAGESQASLLEEAEVARHKAAQEGYEDGLKRGKDDADEATRKLHGKLQGEASAALELQSSRVGQIVKALNAQCEKLVSAAEDDLIAIVHDAVCRILGAQAAAPESVRRMVEQLLTQRLRRAGVVAHVHPLDFELLKLQATGVEPAWRWLADEKVELGGVLLHSGSGSLDARLEVQLQSLHEVLTQTRAQRSGSSAGESPAAQEPPQ